MEELLPVATTEKNGLMSKTDKIRTQDLRNQSAKGYIRIKINNNNNASGYTSIRLTATNGGDEFFYGCLFLNYKSKVVGKHIAVKANASKCYYDGVNSYTYILPIGTAYTGVLEVLGFSNTISDVDYDIVNELDVSTFEEIPIG